jgi:hypothetical protein
VGGHQDGGAAALDLPEQRAPVEGVLLQADLDEDPRELGAGARAAAAEGGEVLEVLEARELVVERDQLGEPVPPDDTSLMVSRIGAS